MSESVKYTVLNNLKIKDKEFIDYADMYRDIFEKITECYKEYLATLEGLSEKLEGNFARNIANYAKVLKTVVDIDVISGEGKSVGRKMKDYIEALDDADQDLY